MGLYLFQFGSNTEITSFNELEYFTGLKSTSSNAFRDCTNLVSARLPEGLTIIDERLFQNCTSLISVKLPESLTSIGAYIINGTPLEIEVNFPNLTSFGSHAFYEAGVTKIHSLGKITILSYRSCYGCKKLTSVVIPDTVTTIEAEVFQGCTALAEINLPKSIITIGNASFNNVPAPMVVDLPNLVSLGRTAFNRSGVVSVVNWGQITTIGNNCFDQCFNLESVLLNEGFTSIGDYAFRLCSKLVIDELNLPKLTSIGLRAFQDVKIGKVTNLGTITSIPEYCFSGNPNLTSVVLPETITELGKSCLGNCTNLTDINLPKSIKVIDSAFGGTKVSMVVDLPNLESISVNAFLNTNIERVESLGKITTLTNVFDGCKRLYYVKLPSSITEITYAAFRNCYSLQTIICEAITPPTISDIFINTNDSFIIYVPGASVSAYKSATNWSKYASRIKPLSELPVNE